MMSTPASSLMVAIAARIGLVWRTVMEIVCTQVTKARPGAGWGGGDHVADLHPAVGDHHAVDQQLHQLAAPLEVGLAQPGA
jgi:hypothetical protein